MTFLKPHGSKRGFTLIELLVGVAVSGLIALFLFWMVAQDARFKALERARGGVREKTQLALDLFQEDFRAIESVKDLDVNLMSFYVRSSGSALLTLDWGVEFKRWLHTSSGNPVGFQRFYVIWGAKQNKNSNSKDWTLYRIVQREAYGQRTEVSRFELGPLERAEIHLFGLDKGAEPTEDALKRLDEAYPYSIPQSELARLIYVELEIEAGAKTLASERMLWTFGENYKPYRFITRVQPRNIEASLLLPKVSMENPMAQGQAMDRVDYIAEGMKTVTIEAIQTGLSALESAVSLATMAAGAATTAAGAATGAVTAVPTLGAGAVAGGAAAAAGGGVAIAAPTVLTSAMGAAADLIIPAVEALIGNLIDWLAKPILRATATPGVVAYSEPALADLSGLTGQTAQEATGGGDQAQGASPSGVGLGVGGTPPGMGGTPASLRALEEAQTDSQASSPGNRFGSVGRSAQPGRGTSLPGQAQGRGYAFGRAGRAQGSQEQAQQEEPTQEPSQGSDEASGWSATFTHSIDISPWKEAWLYPRGFFVASYEGYLFNGQDITSSLTQLASSIPSSSGQTPQESADDEVKAPRGTPRGVGLGVGGTPPGMGGTPASLRALEEAQTDAQASSPGNRFGNVGRSAQPGRGTSLPGQAQGRGYAFGRAAKAQGSQEQAQEGGSEDTSAGETAEEPPPPSGASQGTGIRFVPETQSPYLALMGFPMTAALNQDRQAALTFEGNTFASQDWGKVFVFAPYFMPGQSTPSHPLPISDGKTYDIQVLNSMENVTVGDILAAFWAAFPFSRNTYTAALPFLKMLRTTAEGLEQLLQVLTQATSLISGAGGQTAQGG